MSNVESLFERVTEPYPHLPGRRSLGVFLQLQADYPRRKCRGAFSRGSDKEGGEHAETKRRC